MVVKLIGLHGVAALASGSANAANAAEAQPVVIHAKATPGLTG